MPLIMTWKLHIFKLLCFTFLTVLDSVHPHCNLISKIYLKKINITAIFIELKNVCVLIHPDIFIYVYLYFCIFIK